MNERFRAYQWGDDYDKWGVQEIFPSGHEPLGVLSWLTERQAREIAAVLNDMCGLNWHERHPGWWAEVAHRRQIEELRTKLNYCESQLEIVRKQVAR